MAVNRHMGRIILLMICLTLLSACGQAPGNSELPFVTRAADEGYSYDAPNRIDAENQNEKIKLLFHADVTVPQTDGFTVQKVERRLYDAEDYRAVATALCPDAIWKTEGGELYDWASPLPDERICLFAETPDGRTAQFIMDVPNLSFSFRFGTLYFLAERHCESEEELSAFNSEATISVETAYEAAMEALALLGLKDYDACISDRVVGFDDGEAAADGWQFVMTRRCDSLLQPFYEGYTAWDYGDPPQMTSPWGMEYLYVTVTREGLQSVSGMRLGEQTELVAQDFILLPFDKVLSAITSQLEAQHGLNGVTEPASDWTVEIYSIRLGCALVSFAAGNEGYCIPAWFVEYRLSSTNTASGSVLTTEENSAFSAIDGSYIQPFMTPDAEGVQ
ncbi:MAG: DUF6034 family protein [Clostridia bacterium]|nr:DUF6034 family protein [Clostridia bacterium]